MATTREIIDAFQTINAGITGVTTAPAGDSYPPTLLGVNLPCAITLPGPARWYGAPGLGSARKAQRTYVVRFYLASAEPNVAEPFAQALDLIDAAGTTYRNAKHVNNALIEAGGASVTWTATDGLTDAGFLRTLPYGGGQWYGIEFHVPVIEPS